MICKKIKEERYAVMQCELFVTRTVEKGQQSVQHMAKFLPEAHNTKLSVHWANISQKSVLQREKKTGASNVLCVIQNEKE